MGHGMHIQRQTEKLDLYAACDVMFTIPKSLVFWGVPLPPTPTPTLDIGSIQVQIRVMFDRLAFRKESGSFMCSELAKLSYSFSKT